MKRNPSSKSSTVPGFSNEEEKNDQSKLECDQALRNNKLSISVFNMHA